MAHLHPYLEPLLQKFESNRNPAEAVFMKKYMKGQYEYFGIKAPIRREILREFLSLFGMPPVEESDIITRDCWSRPEREFQYFAMELHGKMARKATEPQIELYEYMLLNKSWWDTVDYISAVLVGFHFRKYPGMVKTYTEKWMASGNIWLQRSSLLFQLKYKEKTDLNLMIGYIEQLAGSREFFINKAIGWVLRQYSKTDRQWVIDYVNSHENLLAPLSRREALKWLDRRGEL